VTAEHEDIERYLARRAEEVNGWLDRLLPSENQSPVELHRAMRYSVFAGGKRLRPALLLASGEAMGAPTRLLVNAACGVELIHTYSLIHDDLPAMDNDDLRRGLPTCHKAFGEAMAILAGDALLTLAFSVLGSGPDELDAALRIKAIREIASAAGSVDGLIGGQVIDLESEGREASSETVEYIHRSKTGALIRASVVCGGIIAGATGDRLQRLGEYGSRIGLAFQIADDVLDVTSTSDQLGKTAGKDAASRKATYPSIYGVEASKQRARELVEEAIEIVSEAAPGAELLKSLARFIVARTS
jgi:geranylgeranyl diphosphate synthase type II